MLSYSQTLTGRVGLQYKPAVPRDRERIRTPWPGSNRRLEEKMTKRKMFGLITMMVLSLASSRAQEWPVSGLYQIISGCYGVCVEVCGLEFSFPNTNHSFIVATYNEQSNPVLLTSL